MLIEGAALRVLVVGAGEVAARKTVSLVRAGAAVRVVAPHLCPELERLGAEGGCQVIRRVYECHDISDAQLVIAATNTREVNARVAADAALANCWVNVADAPETGVVSFMAAHCIGTLTVGVSAGGVPAAAARIRDAIAARFDERYGESLQTLVLARRALLASGEATRWRAASDALIDANFCDAVENGTLSARVSAWR